MPKLTFTQWTLLIAFQVFFGLVVFGLTRTYYETGGSHQAPAVSQAPPVHAPVDPIGGSMQRFSALSVPDEELISDDPELLARLGDSYFGQGEYHRAMVVYERTLRLAPEDVDTYNDLGLVLHYLGQSGRAVQVLEEGIARGPEYQRIRLTLGFVQYQRGNVAEAATALQRAVALGPDSKVGVEAQRMLDSLAR